MTNTLIEPLEYKGLDDLEAESAFEALRLYHREQRRKRAKRASVLLIEDQVDLNRALSIRLRKDGFRVIQAYDGYSGLGNVLIDVPDLVLLDLRLPMLDGFQVLHRLRIHPSTQDAPIVVMTGDPDPTIEARAEAWGIKTVLRKPFSHDVLLRTIRKNL